MKKLMMGLVSAFMLFTLATPVSALDSVSIDNVTVSGLGEKEKVVLSKVSGNDMAEVVAGNKELSEVTGVKDVALLTDVKQFSVIETSADRAVRKFPVSWEVLNITSSTEVYLLTSSNGNDWTLTSTKVENGKVDFLLANGDYFGLAYKVVKAPAANNDKPASKPASGYDDGGPFTTDACGNVFDRWGNEVYHAPVCVNNNAAAGNTYTFVNTGDR